MHRNTRTCLISVSRPPEDKNLLFQPEILFFIFSSRGRQCSLFILLGDKGTSRYFFIGKLPLFNDLEFLRGALFQNKHDASLRLCIDYRAHNNTQNQKGARATHRGLSDQLGAGRYFTKLDWRSGYYPVRIAEGDEGKTTCVTLER